jgi:hypothetical protein
MRRFWPPIPELSLREHLNDRSWFRFRWLRTFEMWADEQIELPAVRVTEDEGGSGPAVATSRVVHAVGVEVLRPTNQIVRAPPTFSPSQRYSSPPSSQSQPQPANSPAVWVGDPEDNDSDDERCFHNQRVCPVRAEPIEMLAHKA